MMPDLNDILGVGCNTVVNDIYQVALPCPGVMLNVAIGYGQNATSVVTLNGVKINGPGPGGVFVRDIINLNLGEIKAGDKLIVSTTVMDINPDPTMNMTSVTLHLSGGVQDKEYPMQCNADNNGTIPYYSRILFVS